MAVLVPVIVEDTRGNRVPDLEASDFQVYEDDIEQRVEGLMPEAEPVNVAVVVDTSRSMELYLQSLKVAAATFIDALEPANAAMVVSFDDRTYLASDLTRDRGRARRGVLALRAAGLTSRLYDAIAATVERLDQVPGRKAMLLLTDGLDVDSAGADASAVRTTIEGSNVVIHTILFDTTHDVRGSVSSVTPRLLPKGLLDNKRALFAEATAFLEGLSATTGGRLEPVSTVERLVEAFTRIGEELRRQYVLYYYPSNQTRDMSLRRIRVEVDRPDVTIRARTAYRAGGGPSSEP